MGQYYGRGLRRKSVDPIYLYTFQQSWSIIEAMPTEETYDGGLFWKENHKKPVAVLEIDLWCSDHPGRRMVVHKTKS